MFRSLILSLLLFGLLLGTQAQNCEEKLKQAQQSFDEGRIRKVEPILSKCLENGFTKDQKIRAYKLLAKTYIYLDRQADADTIVLKILGEDPDQKSDPEADPKEYVVKFSTFKTIPVLSLGASGGFNRSYLNILFYNSTDNISTQSSRDEKQANYTYPLGLQGGITAEIYPFERARIGFQGLASIRLYNYADDNLQETFTQSFTESQFWLELPIYFKYFFKSNDFKLRPYGAVGGTANILLTSTIISGNLKSESAQEVELASVDVKSIRKNFYPSLLLELGARYKLNTANFIFAGIRYNMGFSDMATAKTFYQVPELESIQYIDNDFTMQNYSLSVGYIREFYKAKRVK